MRGRLSCGGSLYIERAGREEEQFCPEVEDRVCGDWCPRLVDDGVPDAEGFKLIELDCCNVYILCKDERGVE